jgi:tetratricopeptide (TPR) repeat protein
MPQDEGKNARDTRFQWSGLNDGIWIGCSLGALFLGVISVTLKPIVSKPWADFCIGLGIALLVFAAVSITLWLVVGGIAKSDQAEPKDDRDPSKPGGSATRTDASKESQSKDAREERRFAQAQGFVLRIFAILLWLGVIGLALYASGLASPLPFWQHFGHVAGTGLLLALGFFAVGMLLGFLFGLPRSPRKSDTQGDSNPKGGNSDESTHAPAGKKEDERTGYGDNTNLEEVSDWLTKIIVGLGLIDLKDAPQQLKRLSDFFAYTCGSEFCGAIFLTLGAFFFVIGFVSSYILARVYVKLAFALADRMLTPAVEKVAKETARETAKETIKEVAEDTQTSWGSVKAMSLVQMASDTNNLKEASDSQLNHAIQFIDEALASKPSEELEYIALIEKGRALKRKARLVKGTEHNRLLEQAVEELDRARRLLPDSGAALYNIACYKSLLDPPSVKEALADLKEGLRLSPNLKKTAKDDDDLKVLRDEPEFKAMVADNGTATDAPK